MKELRHSLFGYNTREVNDSIKALKEDLRYLKGENEKYVRQIEELTLQLRKSKAEEELIRDAIVDAKHLSKRLVREAKEQATEILFEAERDINDQFVQFEQSMSSLKVLRDTIVRQKQELKKELVATIDRYRNVVEEVDQTSYQFDHIEEVIEENFQEAEEVATASKQVIFLPKPLKKTVAEAGIDTTKLSEDIPVYSFQ